MPMYIKNDDLEFLKQVHKDLDDTEYGRSKPEIERMRKQLIEFVTGTGGNK